MAKIYTAFCQNANGKGTIWINPVEADSVEEAISEAQAACANDWGDALEDVHVLGIASGDVKIEHWEDLNDG